MRILLIVSSLFLSMNATAAAVTVDAVLANPLAMTITQTLVAPKKDHSTRAKVTVLPQRGKTFLLEANSDLQYTYQVQPDKNAPLVFIVPGTGGIATGNGVLFLAEQLYSMGYSTVTMDDGFSWSFAVGGSRTGLPGYTPDDSRDLYNALKIVSKKLATDTSIFSRSLTRWLVTL